MHATVQIKSALETLRVMEEDLLAYGALIEQYGSLRNLVVKVNEVRSTLGLPGFGSELD